MPTVEHEFVIRQLWGYCLWPGGHCVCRNSWRILMHLEHTFGKRPQASAVWPERHKCICTERREKGHNHKWHVSVAHKWHENTSTHDTICEPIEGNDRKSLYLVCTYCIWEKKAIKPLMVMVSLWPACDTEPPTAASARCGHLRGHDYVPQMKLLTAVTLADVFCF